jgi:hypothetical protein
MSLLRGWKNNLHEMVTGKSKNLAFLVSPGVSLALSEGHRDGVPAHPANYAGQVASVAVRGKKMHGQKMGACKFLLP